MIIHLLRGYDDSRVCSVYRGRGCSYRVIELSEYTSILCARQTLKELVTTDVETYSRFQNVRYDNLHKYLNCNRGKGSDLVTDKQAM